MLSTHFSTLALIVFACGIHAATSNQTGLIARAEQLLARFPLIDTHVDLPQTMRVLERRPMDAIDRLTEGYPGHVDFPKLRQGGVGGVFLTAWAPCLDVSVTGSDFLKATDSLRDTLELIDLIIETVERFPKTLALCKTARDVKEAFARKKLSDLIGLEGTHMLGNSLSVMRLFAKLGVRYVTLTHVCHSSFASSNGGGAGTSGSTLPPVHPGNGITEIGRSLVLELNRLGVMVDLSHTTDATVAEAISISRAPVIWSHSGARGVYSHPRNVPDFLLEKIGSQPGRNRGIVLSVLYPVFIDPSDATVSRVVDHIEHIASICGRAHVGLASDFDGMSSSVIGLEDASKWPNMIAELLSRGWTDYEVEGIAGGNILRVMEEVAEVSRTLAHERPLHDIYEKRTDLPSHSWGGPNLAYLPTDVKAIVETRRFRDEL